MLLAGPRCLLKAQHWDIPLFPLLSLQPFQLFVQGRVSYIHPTLGDRAVLTVCYGDPREQPASWDGENLLQVLST